MKAKSIKLDFQPCVELIKNLTIKFRSSWEFVIFLKIKGKPNEVLLFVSFLEVLVKLLRCISLK